MITDKIKVQNFLMRLPLFGDLAADELDRIAAGTTELHVARGTRIVERGEACNGFHCVVYGQVKLAFVSAQGSEKVVQIIAPGQSFGEAVMFMEKSYIVSAHALNDCFLLHISKQVVFDELEQNPKFSRRMLAALSRRLHGVMGDVEAGALRSGTQRVIGYLLREVLLAEGDQIELAVGKGVIASRLSLTPEHFSRILHCLSEQQLIGIHGKRISILNLDGLRNHDG